VSESDWGARLLFMRRTGHVIRRRCHDRATVLSPAAAAGDPAAMWDCALELTGLTEAAARFPGNLLPFLNEVASLIADATHHDARDLIARAGAAGHTPAMVVTALRNLPADREAARTGLEQAAGRGDTAAMLCLGTRLAADDPALAQTWLRRLADAGDTAGQFALSSLLRPVDPHQADALLRQAAAAGNLRAQSQIAVAGYELGEQLDSGCPPAADLAGVVTPGTPLTHLGRQVAGCQQCGDQTVQDCYEFIHGRWFGRQGPTTAGKAGARVHFSACAVCGCMFPMDGDSLRYVRSKGAEFFNPATLGAKRAGRRARR
jgi:TPR repeat protein